MVIFTFYKKDFNIKLFHGKLYGHWYFSANPLDVRHVMSTFVISKSERRTTTTKIEKYQVKE